MSWEYEIMQRDEANKDDDRFRGLMIGLFVVLLILALGGFWGA
jgi:hypothetical protein